MISWNSERSISKECTNGVFECDEEGEEVLKLGEEILYEPAFRESLKNLIMDDIQ
jgi:hypothetical protein